MLQNLFSPLPSSCITFKGKPFMKSLHCHQLDHLGFIYMVTTRLAIIATDLVTMTTSHYFPNNNCCFTMTINHHRNSSLHHDLSLHSQSMTLAIKVVLFVQGCNHICLHSNRPASLWPLMISSASNWQVPLALSCSPGRPLQWSWPENKKKKNVNVTTLIKCEKEENTNK